MIKWVELNQHALELYGSESVRSAEWVSSFPSANPITWHAHPPDSISADTFTLVICCLRSADQRMTNDPRRKASHRLVLSENERLYGTQIKLISFRCQRTQLARPATAAPLLRSTMALLPGDLFHGRRVISPEPARLSTRRWWLCGGYIVRLRCDGGGSQLWAHFKMLMKLQEPFDAAALLSV